MKKGQNKMKGRRAVSSLKYLIFAGAMLLCSGCGNKEEATQIAADVTEKVTTEAEIGIDGKTQSYGNFTEVFIPADMKPEPGKLAGSDNPKALWIQLKENDAHSYLLQLEDEEICKSSIAYSKESNKDSKDVTFVAGGRTWTGVTYRYMDMMDCFQVYSMDGQTGILVSASWYNAEDPRTMAILSGIKLK